MPRTALITDADGIAGVALLKHLLDSTSKDEWTRIVVNTRSKTHGKTNDNRIHFIDLDFSRRPGTLIEHMTGPCASITHAFFCSYVHKESFEELNKANAELFENFLLALTATASALENVTLLSSSKYYGSHISPVPTPCREDDVRRGDPADNFYHAQEDFLTMLQMNQTWTWNVIRPEPIVSAAVVPGEFNIALTLAMYFMMTEHVVEEARMPTNERCWNGIAAFSDAKLLAEFCVWAAINDDCAQQAFNFSNGDHLVWRFVWPLLADQFGAYSTPDQIFQKPEPVRGMLQQEFSLVEWASDKKAIWDRVCEETGILEARESFSSASWSELDSMFQRSWSVNVSVNKARKFGWTGIKDSFDCFVDAFEALRQENVLP
ncbi:3-oxo-Delta(4,5)-steroid 5-beta-reductase [Cercospora beticola]|uniref:3-oxo-Delta(4,5)-steroid 5-beta-reductase n=1 Tax=Cercospora beticola TaxID=122368 RepID=A0A2G5HA68_CERBT|nr:3-oxo-Delta(4,5)-steroid 5-beta-reductase [Cercospora beticola]PIA89435.1 3-oxo-Delta(4,5)-steroid 5-beta-reductase [Cercospora beticola]WPB03900.1 hypothetical protein RHO25_008544 [Cercospora beticola]